jgi:SAM-dependent methyltransferase
MAAESETYIIRGGIEGRERLRLLARVLRPTTLDLFERVGVRPGMSCLDVGCGGGDVCADLARLVGPTGRVVGVDIDGINVDLARREAAAQGISNVEFRVADVTTADIGEQFDFVFVRFVLTHLHTPAGGLARIRHAIRPGGIVTVVDIDFRGHFCHPDNRAFSRYVEWYTETGIRRGADPNIGPRLPSLLIENGFQGVRMNVVQLADLDGEVKLVAPVTMQHIADNVVGAGLATAAEVDAVVAELFEFARTPNTIVSTPRLVETWGTAPQ